MAVNLPSSCTSERGARHGWRWIRSLMATPTDTWKTNPTIAALFSPSGRLCPLFNHFLPSSLWPHPSLLPVFSSSRLRSLPCATSFLIPRSPLRRLLKLLWPLIHHYFQFSLSYPCSSVETVIFPPLVLQFHLIVLVWLHWGRRRCFDWKLESFNSCSQKKKKCGERCQRLNFSC